MSIQNISVDTVEIPLHQNWKKIGISVSGGADSALLAYVICSHTNADIHITTQVRNWKSKPWQQHNSIEVYDWLKNRFKNLNFFRHEGFIPPELEWGSVGPTISDEYGRLKSGDRIILRSFNEYICHKENIDAWFAAVTKNPPVYFKGALEDRNVSTIPEIDEHLDVIICHPFINVTKDWIIKKYYDLNILELLKITRSCEGDNKSYPDIFNGLDYKTYVSGQCVPECEQCFWCKERQWGIDNAHN